MRPYGVATPELLQLLELLLQLPLPGAASLSRPLQDAPKRYAAKAGPNPAR
jgi:hypothetical protein